MPRAGGSWLTRRKSMPTMILASQGLCGLTFVLEDVRRRQRERSWPPARLPYSRTASSLARRAPFANVAAKSCEARSKRSCSTPAFGLKRGRSAAGPGL
jgi:hypothetical protein